MPVLRLTRVPALLFLFATVRVLSQEAVDLVVVDRVKDEAFKRSEVMDDLRNLTDVRGPRLTGSPQFDEAAQWTVQRLTSDGRSNVHLEHWGPFGRSWSVEAASAEMIAPHYARLAAAPLAWSAATAGTITGEPLLTPVDVSFLLGFKRIAENFDAYRHEWSGKLRGRIVLLGRSKPERHREKPLFTRYSDAELGEMAKAPEPAAQERAANIDE